MAGEDGRGWTGIFQGGGARGIAYAGALRAFQRTGRFTAVAGASAGAITAALVAAGADAAYLEEHGGKLLESLRTRLGAFDKALRLVPVVGQGLCRWQSSGLWGDIDRRLVELSGVVTEGPITFADLTQRANNIDLYVVAFDVTAGIPIVFSHRTTPNISVASAVVASSSIPMAFDNCVAGAAQFVEPTALHPWPIAGVLHLVVDGGAFANYPSFIFTDKSWRTLFHVPDEQADHLIGFTLSAPTFLGSPITLAVPGVRGEGAADDLNKAQVLRRRFRSLARPSEKKPWSLPTMRWLMFVLLLGPLSVPPLLIAAGKPGLGTAVALSELMIARYARAFGRTAMPVLQSWMASHTTPPPTAGRDGNCVIFLGWSLMCLNKSAKRVRTTTFKIKETDIRAIVDEADRLATWQLDSYRSTGQSIFATQLTERVTSPTDVPWV